LYDLAREMNVRYGKLAVIVNRVQGTLSGSQIDELREATGADWVMSLPEDAEIAGLGRNGEGIWPVTADNPVNKLLGQFLSEAGIHGGSGEVPL
jgi:MinD superfamily P-loop ATPase